MIKYLIIHNKLNGLQTSMRTRHSMIGSPERVNIQRSLVQNLSKVKQRLKIIERFLTFWGIKIPPKDHNNFWGSK